MKKYNNLILKKIASKKYWLVITFFIILGISGLCWYFFPDFGLNFFTEMLGAGITIFILNVLIILRIDYENIPLKLAEYKDVSKFIFEYLNFWVDIYKIGFPNDKISKFSDLFSQDAMSKILLKLDFNSDVNDFPLNVLYPQKIHELFIEKIRNIENRGNILLNRYSNSFEPNVFNSIHQLTDSNWHQHLFKMSWLFSNANPQKGLINNLSSELFVKINIKEEDIEAVKSLYNWCCSQFEILKEHDNSIKIPFLKCKFDNLSLI